MNQHFCYHPWAGLDVAPSGEIKPCCKFRPDLENWKKFYIQDGVKTYTSSEEILNLRKQFLEGKKPAGCVRCWKDEAAGYPSKRQIDYNNFTAELDRYDLSSQDRILFFDIPMGNFCNLKCRICNPGASTTWIKEWKDLFGEKFKTQDWHQNPKVWNDLISYTKDSLEIHVSGGEPFLYDTSTHLDLLDSLIQSNSSKNIKLHYNTNGTVFPKEDYWKKWKSFSWVDVSLSIDDMEQRFEYNRHPANWDTVKENLLQYRNRIVMRKNMQLSISTTVSAFTIFYLEEFFDFMSANHIPEPWLGRLNHPHYYRASVFPDHVKEKIREKLQNSKYKNIQKIVSWLDDDDSKQLDNFLKYVDLHDQYRKENFQQIFPELYAMLNLNDK